MSREADQPPPNGPAAHPGMEISKRLLAVNTFSAVATHVIQLSVLVWLQQYLLAHVPLDEYSIYPPIVAVMMFVPLLSVTVTSGLERYTVAAYANGDDVRVTQIISTMFPLTAAVGLVVLIAGGCCAWWVDALLRVPAGLINDARIMLGLLMLLASVRVILAPLSLGFYIRQRFVQLNGIQLSVQFLRLGILLALLFGVSARVVWVVVATVSAEILGLLVTWLWSRRLVPALRFIPGRINWSIGRELLSFSGWRFVQQLAWVLRTGAPTIILNRLASPLDVTCFYLGSLPNAQIQRTAVFTTASWQPALTAMYAKGRRDSLAQAYIQGGRYALWSVLAICVPLLVFRNEVIKLWVGSEFQQASVVMGLLLLSLPVTYANYMVAKLVLATGTPRPLALRTLAMQLINIAAMVYVVHWRSAGAVGAAWTVLIVNLMLQPLWLYGLGWRVAGIGIQRWWRGTFRPGVIPALIGGAAWFGLHVLVMPDSWFALIACSLGGGAAYLLGLLLALQPYERDLVRKFTRRVGL